MTALTWGGLWGVLPTDEARSYVGIEILRAGFSPSEFATRIGVRRTVAECLTRIEDVLDLDRRAYGLDRARIRSFRRALERELWP